jgi:hypothetical protein
MFTDCVTLKRASRSRLAGSSTIAPMRSASNTPFARGARHKRRWTVWWPRCGDLGVVAATRGTTPEPAKSVLERVQADMEPALGTDTNLPRVYDLHATRRVLSEWAGVEKELAALPPEDHEIARLEASRASTKAALDAVATIADLDRSNRVGGKGRLSGEAALLDAQTMNALAHLVDTILSLMDVDHKPTIGLRPIRKGDSKAGFGAELVPVRIGESDRGRSAPGTLGRPADDGAPRARLRAQSRVRRERGTRPHAHRPRRHPRRSGHRPDSGRCDTHPERRLRPRRGDRAAGLCDVTS